LTNGSLKFGKKWLSYSARIHPTSRHPLPRAGHALFPFHLVREILLVVQDDPVREADQSHHQSEEDIGADREATAEARAANGADADLAAEAAVTAETGESIEVQVAVEAVGAAAAVVVGRDLHDDLAALTALLGLLLHLQPPHLPQKSIHPARVPIPDLKQNRASQNQSEILRNRLSSLVRCLDSAPKYFRVLRLMCLFLI
jgi:hypothetical protein